MTNIDTTAQISSHFTYGEALWLPTWGRMGNDTDGLTGDVIARLTFLFQKMDVVRDYFGKPIRVHVAWRPEAYNRLIGGATNSAHRAQVDGSGAELPGNGMEAAVDFDVEGLTCDQARQMILNDNKLEEWGMRMEDNGAGASWIHLDTRQPLPGHQRFFKP